LVEKIAPEIIYLPKRPKVKKKCVFGGDNLFAKK
jgi:hypothetical protein